MVKHPHKRQKTSREKKPKAKTQIKPLGSNEATVETEKDDEEKKLEALLFGVPYIPSENADKGKGKDMLLDLGESNGEEDVDRATFGAGKEMEGMMDSDLFYIDDGIPSAVDQPDGDNQPLAEDIPSEDETHDSDGHSPVSSLPPPAPKPGRAPAWTDPADESISVSVDPSSATTSKRLLKLRDAPDETSLSGREYERRLRRQFEKINPEPTWAVRAREKARGKRRRSTSGGEDSDDGTQDDDRANELDTLLTSTSGILSRTRIPESVSGKVVLPPTTLSISRLRDANQSVQNTSCGVIKAVAFHPSDKVPLLCVGSADRRVRLFNVDGHTSPLLQTLHIPSLPLTSASTTFHPLGNHLLLTGPRPYYYIYDLQSGRLRKSERGLWGTTFSGVNDTSSILSRRRNSSKGGNTPESIQIHAFSPSQGTLLAVAGRTGYIHLVDWQSGAGQVIGSLKMTAGVKGLWWTSSTPSLVSNEDQEDEGSDGDILGAGRAGGGHLVSLSTDSEVYIWDVGARRCVKRWRDEGGFRGSGLVLAGSSQRNNDGWLAIGSNTGLVNVYGSDSFSPSVKAGQVHPKPVKVLGNLTTPISTLRFNPDGQLLAMASQEKKDAMRLIHLPSLTTFANWPTSSTPLGHVTSVDFSAGSEYLAIGNTRGKVLLYHLRDYGIPG